MGGGHANAPRPSICPKPAATAPSPLLSRCVSRGGPLLSSCVSRGVGHKLRWSKCTQPIGRSDTSNTATELGVSNDKAALEAEQGALVHDRAELKMDLKKRSKQLDLVSSIEKATQLLQQHQQKEQHVLERMDRSPREKNVELELSASRTASFDLQDSAAKMRQKLELRMDEANGQEETETNWLPTTLLQLDISSWESVSAAATRSIDRAAAVAISTVDLLHFKTTLTEPPHSLHSASEQRHTATAAASAAEVAASNALHSRKNKLAIQERTMERKIK